MKRCGKDAENSAMPILQVNNVTKKFGELVAVNNLSFSVKNGQVFGIAGPNGAGKSTVYNLITGYYPFEGRIEFDGSDISGLQPHRISQLGIARTFQTIRLWNELTVLDTPAAQNDWNLTGAMIVPSTAIGASDTILYLNVYHDISDPLCNESDVNWSGMLITYTTDALY